MVLTLYAICIKIGSFGYAKNHSKWYGRYFATILNLPFIPRKLLDLGLGGPKYFEPSVQILGKFTLTSGKEFLKFSKLFIFFLKMVAGKSINFLFQLSS